MPLIVNLIISGLSYLFYLAVLYIVEHAGATGAQFVLVVLFFIGGSLGFLTAATIASLGHLFATLAPDDNHGLWWCVGLVCWCWSMAYTVVFPVVVMINAFKHVLA